MSQRVAGERARWLAAMLMVAAIGAAGVIVRIWPVEQATPALVSSDIHLFEPAPAPRPVVAAILTSRPSVRPRTGRPGQRFLPDVAPVPRAESLPASVEAVIAPESTVQAAAAVGVDAPAVNVDVPLQLADASAPAADAASEIPRPVAASEVVPTPAAASARGIAELPAVAVTRAVTIAGRGIMTGLKATTAILRAPF